jgi:hypothetical protein
MDNYQTLIEKAKKGFAPLDLPENFKVDALGQLKTWLTDRMFAAYVPQIDHLIASGQWEFLLDSFYQVIPFGTGGRRGLVGVGPNRINPWDHPGIGPGAQPIPDQGPGRVGQNARAGAGLRCAPIHRYRALRP